MMAAHREGTDARRTYAEQSARILLEHADLPLLLRARALMILGCSDEGDFVSAAREAVRIAQLAKDQ